MKKKTSLQTRLSLLLCLVLVAATALLTSGCKDNQQGTPSATTVTNATVSTVLGEGATVFPLTVLDADGKTTAFEIHTDKKTVGEALLALNFIAGDNGEYGIYVKTVNGMTVEYENGGKYWAFYINGEYAMTGVEKTPITPDTAYQFKVE